MNFAPWLAFLLVLALVVLSTRHLLPLPDLSRPLRERLERDALDPYRGWVQSAFLIVTGDCDYGHLDRKEARRMLEQWWDIHGASGVEPVLSKLANAGRPDNAWDLIRFMVVARLAVGADYLEDEVSWDLIRPIALRLQGAYSGWRAMAQAYVLARRQWRNLPLDGSDDDEEMGRILANIVALHERRWSQIPYELDF